jgi:thymidylate synthase (FAD)
MKLETAKDKTIITPIAMTQPIVDFIPDAEGLLAYQARVSNPSNQLNFDTADKLLKYCANHGHWSVFEMVNVVLEIKAPRDISRQILRHRSNAFQEFSQRYADVTSDMFCLRELRMQDTVNRQNSVPCQDSDLRREWMQDQNALISEIQRLQKKWRDLGTAKEVVRVIMPEGLTMSSMYVNFNVRSLMHYIDVRSGNGTQLEHQDVALKALEVVKPLFPNSFEYFGSKYE